MLRGVHVQVLADIPERFTVLILIRDWDLPMASWSELCLEISDWSRVVLDTIIVEAHSLNSTRFISLSISNQFLFWDGLEPHAVTRLLSLIWYVNLLGLNLWESHTIRLKDVGFIDRICGLSQRSSHCLIVSTRYLNWVYGLDPHQTCLVQAISHCLVWVCQSVQCGVVTVLVTIFVVDLAMHLRCVNHDHTWIPLAWHLWVSNRTPFHILLLSLLLTNSTP